MSTSEIDLSQEIPGLDLAMSYESFQSKARIDPYGTFDACPIWEIKRQCVNRIQYDLLNIHPDWFEHRIWQMNLKQLNPDLAGKMLELYLSRGDARSVKFLFNMREKFEAYFSLSKHIHKVLGANPGLYWEVPGIQEFLKYEFKRMSLDHKGNPKKEYGDFEYHPAERVLRRVLTAGDITWLDVIKGVSERLETGKLRLTGSDAEDPFASATNISRFQVAVKELEKAKAEQQPDLSAQATDFIRKQHGIKGEIKIEVFLLDGKSGWFSKGIERGEKACISIEFQPTIPEDYMKLAAAVSQMKMSCEGVGFKQINEAPSYAHDPVRLHANFWMTDPLMDHSRITISFVDDNQNAHLLTCLYLDPKKQEEKSTAA